ncbi:GFA family protein [Pseudomonas sp. SO81]|uniref:GFA family protein n=1 Tax=Pseudomonas sp. SO81 TaxID=2983246 RepID=UPI0025A41626|nr:GFA family protein [Pseudomonas sp. SO81]WJN61484.1 hypothetical protein OH686_22305 [Pseudomonas sp. SO81]
MHVHGSCHCGGVQYQALVDPERTTICHCTDCQKLTGSAYRVSVPAVEGSFQLVSGEPSIYVKIGDAGSRRAQAFCPNCGSPLYTYDADQPKIYGLRVGCLEERQALVPRQQKWCRSALPWTQSLTAMTRREAE